MASTLAFRCDICGTPKKQTNHWWLIVTGDEKSELQKTAHNHDQNSTQATPKESMFLVVPWQSELATRPGAHHACGQLCVQRAVERFMSGVEIFPALTPPEAAIASSYEHPLEKILSQQGNDHMDFDTLVNSVAESVVQSAMMGDEHPEPLAVDSDELGELSAVLSHARPKVSRERNTTSRKLTAA